MTPDQLQKIAKEIKAMREDIAYDIPCRKGFDHTQRDSLLNDLESIAESLEFVADNLEALYKGDDLYYSSFADLHPEPKR